VPRSRNAPAPSASGSAAEPLSPAEFAAALGAIGGFEPRPLLAVAVSGGPDSLALAILADRWARERGGMVWGLTVDHRLRPESGAEAAAVGRWLAARGIPHGILAWEGDKPAAGIQAAARDARYRLLSAWCAGQGCLHLLTAHHREDQAETYLIRRRAGSGVDGLAGIAAVRELAQLRLVRPLLGVPRARLAALLDAERQEYFRDPSNRNPAFERSRLRMGMSEGDGAVALSELRVNARRRIGRERELADLLASAVALHPAGFALVEPPALLAAGELGERALGRVAAAIGGAAYPLRRERLARLRTALAAFPGRPQTLGGCRFVPWRGRVLVLRETARAAHPQRLDPGMSVIWDGRFAATLAAHAAPMALGCLGRDGATELGRGRPSGSNPLPRLVYPSLPALRDGEGLAAVPHLDYSRSPGTSAMLVFRPSAPLLGASFTVV
jgi:tRNA(Ile)-lysidine synthase